jgi:hypothetical protein
MTSRPLSRAFFEFNLLLTFFLLCALLTSAPSAHSQVSVAWTTRFGAPGLVATPVAVVSDSLGNVYATGTVTILSGSGAHLENLTIKYDSRGNIVWKFWLGDSTHQAQGQAIGLDDTGNVYVLAAASTTASSQATISNSEFATIKYTPAGVREWIEYFPPAPGGNNFPTHMAVAPGGDVYVTGTSSFGPSGNPSQVLTVNYRTTGAMLWSSRAPIPADGTNTPAALGLDAAENVYLGVTSSHFYPTVYKYDASGNLLGSFVVKQIDGFNAFHVDSAGNIYTAGCTAPGPAAVKLDPNGNELWTHAFTPSRCFSSLQLDPQGNVVLAQTLLHGSGGTTSDISVVKLDPSGAQLWQASFNGSNGAGRDFAQGLAIDTADNIYLTGFTQTNPGSNGSEQGDVIAFKYSPSGQQLWSQRFADGSPSALFPQATTLASGNSLIVSATSIKGTQAQTESDWLTLAFSQTVTSQTNPIASIAQPLVPSAVAPGGADFTLTINGTGFVPGSVVLWNGQSRATTFVNQTEVQATIKASDIAQASSGRITVRNPQPGGGLSAVAFLPVRTPAAQVNFALVPVNNSATAFPQNGPILTQTIDVNNDGKLDLISTPNSNENTGASADQVNVQLGNGDGSFQPPIATAAFQGVFVVGYGDFNGDGNIDLIIESGSVSQQDPHFLAVMLGNGDGTFQAPKQIADPTTVPQAADELVTQGSVAVADLNGDGKLDIVYTNTYTLMGVTVLFGNGDGTFTAGGQFATDAYAVQIGLADLNRDGKLDLVLAGSQPFNGETRSVVEILLGNGDGTFGAEQIVPGTQSDTTGAADPANFAVADFNGDGIPDLVYFSPRPALFYPGNGDGTFGTPVATPVSGSNGGANRVTLLGDFSGDGKLDLWLPQEDVLLLGNGDGTFATAFNTESLNTPSLVLAGVAGDFNGDGKIDAAGVVNGVDADGNGTVTINILEQNALFPSITVSPNSLSFAPQQVGTESAPQLITVTNTGSAPLDWFSSSIAGQSVSSFPEQSNDCPSVLPPGGSCQFIFTFLPQTGGPLSATFSIFDNFPGSPQTVSLSGTGSAVPQQANAMALFGSNLVGIHSNAAGLVTCPSIPFVNVVGDFDNDGEIDAATVVHTTMVVNGNGVTTSAINILKQVAP